MKTYVVRVEGEGRSWTGNAESAIEAVQYAMAKGGLVGNEYLVFDWNLDASIVTVTGEVVSPDGSTTRSDVDGRPGA